MTDAEETRGFTEPSPASAEATDAARWVEESRAEYLELLRTHPLDEPAFQDWLERHPAFVPGARGPRGRSGWHPWPCALITQPRLTGIEGKQPDFCWLAADSATITAVLIEIETPAKRWQHKGNETQHAELTHAREQIASWRAWFNDASNQVGFLDQYLVPDSYRRLSFQQHYILIHGSREEIGDDRTRIRQRAAGTGASDEEQMTFDRLPEIVNSEDAIYGCIRRTGSSFEAVAVPAPWRPERFDRAPLRVVQGYEDAVAAAPMEESRRTAVLDALQDRGGERRDFRFRF